MIPDFDNNGKVSPWEGAAADAWHAEERQRLSHRQPRRSSGCGNVAFGCALLLGAAVTLGIVFVACTNLFI